MQNVGDVIEFFSNQRICSTAAYLFCLTAHHVSLFLLAVFSIIHLFFALFYYLKLLVSEIADNFAAFVLIKLINVLYLLIGLVAVYTCTAFALIILTYVLRSVTVCCLVVI